MTAHLNDSDRQALRLAHELREEMRAALPPQAAAPSVSPFVDPSGTPSVLLRMDADTARALMAVLGERRAEQTTAPPAEPRRADGSHVPPPPAPPAYPQRQPPQMPPQAPMVPAGPRFAEPQGTAPYYMEQPVAGAPVFPAGAPLLPTSFPAR